MRMPKQVNADKWSKRFMRHGVTMTACFIAMTASAARAEPQYLPTPLEIALPNEREILTSLLTKSENLTDQKEILKTLDEALGKLPQPTKLRGFVQFLRAGSLAALNDEPKAISAIEESIRLLPSYSAPLLTAAFIYGYSDRPGLGVDYFLRASSEDPDTVRTTPDYEVDSLRLRMRVANDERRLRALSNRLIEIDWTGSNLESGSSLAKDVIKLRLKDGDVAGARALVPRLLTPAHSRDLLIDNSNREIWPNIEAWTGAKLEQQWAIYLNEARKRWMATKDSAAVGTYLKALLAAGHDDTIIVEILPLFDRADKEADYDLIFLVSGVAQALARKGRWQDVDALFGRAQKIWPLGEQANALNVAANRGSHLLVQGRFSDALAQLDAAIADAYRWGAQVNADALSGMHQGRACTLHALGRDAEAGISVALAKLHADATKMANLQLCMGDAGAARQTLIAGLKKESDRESVLIFVQRPDERVAGSDYARQMKAKMDALRKDPKLLAAVAKYGRILPYQFRDGAPSDPARR